MARDNAATWAAPVTPHRSDSSRPSRAHLPRPWLAHYASRTAAWPREPSRCGVLGLSRRCDQPLDEVGVEEGSTAPSRPVPASTMPLSGCRRFHGEHLRCDRFVVALLLLPDPVVVGCSPQPLVPSWSPWKRFPRVLSARIPDTSRDSWAVTSKKRALLRSSTTVNRRPNSSSTEASSRTSGLASTERRERCTTGRATVSNRPIPSQANASHGWEADTGSEDRCTGRGGATSSAIWR